VVTGRYADIGLALGAKTSNSVSLNRDVMRLETILDSNALVTQRLSASQLALEMPCPTPPSRCWKPSSRVNGTDDATRLTVMRRDVEASLSCLHVCSQHLVQWRVPVRGINTDVKPLADYLEAGSPPKAAFDATFLGHFGFTQDDPAAATITAQMDNFLDQCA
jgi:flagellar hook-associated protein 3 FlgL